MIADQRGRRPPAILVLEDEAPLRNAITFSLERAGYHVLTAKTIVDAIQVAADHELHLDLLLSDFGLHRVIGRHVADLLQQDRPELRVLYVSGHAQREILPDGLASGTAFLPKPFSMEALLAEVRALLDRTGPGSGIGNEGIALLVALCTAHGWETLSLLGVG